MSGIKNQLHKLSRLSLAILLISFLFQLTVHGQPEHIDQQVDYFYDDASEIYIVWGINGWKTIPQELMNEQIIQSDNKLLSPMRFENGRWTASLPVPENSRIDLMFWVTRNQKGDYMDKWDTNEGKGYHFKASGEPLVIHSKPAPKASGKLNWIKRQWPGILALLILGIALIFRNKLKWTNPQYIVFLTAFSVISLLFHAVNRAHILNISLFRLIKQPEKLLDDGLLIAFTLLAFLVAGMLWKKGRRQLKVFFIIISSLFLMLSSVNVEVVRRLGHPLNYRWLYYSDFLGSTEARTALMANTSPGNLLHVVGTVLLFIVLSYGTITLAAAIVKNHVKRIAQVVAAILILTTILIWVIRPGTNGQPETVNPVIYLTASVWETGPESSLFTMDVAHMPLNRERQPMNTAPSPIRNVIVIVLESAGAEYFDLYGGEYGITPNLSNAAANSLIIDNMYAHAPATNKSMVSLLCSMYPWISYHSITQEYPDFEWPSLPSVFRENGYRTSFMSSSDLSFQRSDEFLQNRSFDLVSGYDEIGCGDIFKMDNFGDGFGVGASDLCLTDALMGWIDKSPDTPFFSMLWTNQGHYPYFFEGEETDFGVNNIYLNRYLNIIGNYDRLVGDILDQLERRGLTDSTLIAVVGDHGEAFGHHNQSGHGNGIYEENLHVPMMFINPGLFRGDRFPEPSGLINVAPAILEMTNLPVPEEWQGSGIREGNSEPVFFFSPWSEYLFGVRSGQWKAIFNETTGQPYLYNLSEDPAEMNSHTDQYPEVMESYRRQVASWIQSHDDYMRHHFGISSTSE